MLHKASEQSPITVKSELNSTLFPNEYLYYIIYIL